MSSAAARIHWSARGTSLTSSHAQKKPQKIVTDERGERCVPLPVQLIVAGHVPDYCATDHAELARGAEFIAGTLCDQLARRVGGHRLSFPPELAHGRAVQGAPVIRGTQSA